MSKKNKRLSAQLADIHTEKMIDHVDVLFGGEKSYLPTSVEVEDLSIDIPLPDDVEIPCGDGGLPQSDQIDAEAATPNIATVLKEVQCIAKRQEKKKPSYLHEAKRLLDTYTIWMVGYILYVAIGNKFYLAIPHEARASEILRPLLGKRFHTIQNVKEVFSELLSLAPQKPKNFFDCPSRILIPLSDVVWDVERDVKLTHNLTYCLDFLLPFSSEDVELNLDNSQIVEFITELCGYDEDMVLRLQMALSAALLNVNLHQVFYLVGGEGFGRVFLLQLLEDAIGHENVCNLSFADMAKNFRLSHVVGKHCNVSFEEGNQVLSNLDTIKKLAHGVGVNSDKKYGEAFDFVSTATIYCGGTDLPNVAHGRIESLTHQLTIIRLVPTYIVNFKMQRALRKEIDFFRSWLVEGAFLLSQNDFQIHEAKGCDLEDWQERFDLFLGEKVHSAPNAKCFSRDITDAYCDEMGLSFISSKERTGLQGRLQEKFGVPLSKSIRIGNKVSSGYWGVGIDIEKDEEDNEDGK